MEIKHKLIKILSCIILTVMLISTFSLCLFAKTGGKPDSATLKAQMNEFIAEIKSNGVYDEVLNYWLDGKNLDKHLGEYNLDGENGHLVFGTCSIEPYSYVIDGERIGFTIEIIYKFCEKYGYTVEFNDYSNQSGIIAAIQMGTCDFGGGNCSITEERKKSVDFSDSYYNNRVVIIVNRDRVDELNTREALSGKTLAVTTGSMFRQILNEYNPEINVVEYNSVADCCGVLDLGLVDGVCYDDVVIYLAQKSYPDEVETLVVNSDDQYGIVFQKSETIQSESFLGSIKKSFYRNFIQGKRYLLILKGLQTTIDQTVVSVIFGTILGFLVFLFTKRDNIIVNAFCRLVDGLPSVVLLMVLYYVVFAGSGLNGEIVSIICFSLIFGSSTLGLLRTSVGAIDKGQFEVTSALGFGKHQGFFSMILPQALSIAFPGYEASVISLIKATAIVGYIALQDLTKAGDMIRSSTFEAFFPLLCVAIIYFVMAWLLTKTIRLLGNLVVVKKGSVKRFLKGVDLSDRD